MAGWISLQVGELRTGGDDWVGWHSSTSSPNGSIGIADISADSGAGSYFHMASLRVWLPDTQGPASYDQSDVLGKVLLPQEI